MKNLLFVNQPQTDDKQRLKEFAECLRRNKKVFDMVFVKVGEYTVADLVAEANRLQGDISVIANADVYFDKLDYSSLSCLNERTMYALTRYENGAFLCREDSSDAWIFKGRIRLRDCAFRLGLRGSDNAICNRAQKAGYKVINPSLNIRIHHLHKIRRPNELYAPQPYNLDVKPSSLSGGPLIFATSINPSDRLKEQQEALKTWKQGYNTFVLSFNTEEEIKKLAKYRQFADVVFVKCENPVSGKYPRFDEIMYYLKKIDAARYVLINSDIRISGYPSFEQVLLRDEFILGVRRDIKDTDMSLFDYGYDVFCFRKRHLSFFNEKTDYALGLPFHDFYTPLKLLEYDERIDVDRSHFYHEWHETRYDNSEWCRLADYSKKKSCFIARDKDYGDFTTANKTYIENHLNNEI